MDELLSQIYFSEKTGYSSAQDLYKQAKAQNKKITLKYVKEWLKNQESNQIIRQKTKGGHTIVPTEDSYQMDLVFLPNYSRVNRGYIGLLTIINNNTRFVYVYSFKTKTKSEITKLFEQFLKDINYKIKSITTDKGSEFLNDYLEDVFKKNNIEHYATLNKNGLAFINSFHRTLKLRLEKYFTAKKTHNWIDSINSIIYKYNHSYHSGIKKKPSDVTKEDEIKLRNERALKSLVAIQELEKFKEGDRVRVLISKGTLDKGPQKYSEEIYTLKRIDGLNIVLQNEKGNELKKKYKYYQLLKVKAVEKQAPKEKDKRITKKQIDVAKRQQRFEKEQSNIVKRRVKGPFTRLKPANEKRVPKPKKRD